MSNVEVLPPVVTQALYVPLLGMKEHKPSYDVEGGNIQIHSPGSGIRGQSLASVRLEIFVGIVQGPLICKRCCHWIYRLQRSCQPVGEVYYQALAHLKDPPNLVLIDIKHLIDECDTLVASCFMTNTLPHS